MKCKDSSGGGKNVPPGKGHVAIYFLQKGRTVEDIDKFFNFYESIGWANKAGKPFRNWKTLACEWIWDSSH